MSQIAYNNVTQPNLLPVSVTSKLGNNTAISTTAYTYNNLSQVLTTDGPDAGTADTVYNRYEANGRPIGSVSADPDGAGPLPRVAQRITYASGLPVTQETGTVTDASDAAWTAFTPDQQVDTIYDQYGRPAVQRHRAPGSGTTQYSVTQTSYDSAGRVECTVQRMNAPSISTVLPGAPTANLATTTNSGLVCSAMTAGSDGPDRITRNNYDSNGRLTSVESGVGTGLLQTTQAFGYRTASNQNGQLAWVQDAEGSLTAYSYDGFGRRNQTNYPDPNPLVNGTSNPSDYDRITFDAQGRIATFRNRANDTFTFAYDGLNRVKSVDVPTRSGLAATHTRDVFYGYDLFSNMEYARFDSTSGEGIVNTWNALGQLVQSENTMDATNIAVSYLYDASGRQTRVTHDDGAWFEYTFDAMGRPSLVRNQSANTLVTFSYNAQGRLLGQLADSAAPDSTFSYDAAGRLSGLAIDHQANNAFDVTYGWGYNPASQIASQSRDNDGYAFAPAASNIAYVANGLNQYTSVAGATQGYDTNGNLTSDGTRTYGYDTENRMVTATFPSGTVTMRYDPLGRLYEVTDTNGAKRRLFYSGDALIAEYNASGTMLNRYVHGTGAGDDPLAQFTGSSVALADTYFLTADARGSVVLTARRDGSSTVLNTYDEYGVPGAGNAGRFSYTGQTWVPELGMLYYKARMYSPTLGRFMQTDPIGYGDGMNIYAYVGGDPINGVDPLGHKAQCISQDRVTFCGADTNAELPDVIVVEAKRERCKSGWRCGLGYGGGRVGASFVVPIKQMRARSERARLSKKIQNYICNTAFEEDGNSSGVVSLGASGSANAPIVGGVVGQASIAVDGAGNVGLVFEAGKAFGFGFGGALGARGGFSSASSVEAMAGPSLGANVTLGDGVGGSVDVSVAPDSSNASGGITVGLGAGFSASSTVSDTVVLPLFDISEAIGCSD